MNKKTQPPKDEKSNASVESILSIIKFGLENLDALEGSDKKVKSISFAISKAIQKRGTIPNPFFSRAVTLAQSKWNIKVEDLS